MKEHKEKPKETLEEMLTDAQLTFLSNWITMEGLAPDTLSWDDSLLNGVRVWADDPKTDERWEIDFVRRREIE